MSEINFVDLYFGNAKITFFKFNTKDAPDWSPVWHNHIFYELHFSFTAIIKYKFSDREITLSPGEMLIIPPATEHESVTVKYPKKDFFVLSLNIQRLNTGEDFYQSFITALKKNSIKTIKIPENLKESLFTLDNLSLYDTMLGICQLKNAASQVALGLFGKILCDKRIKNESKNQKVLIDLMINYKEVTLDDIAKATNYSKRQIGRIIKEQYGITFTQIRKTMQNTVTNKE